MLFPTARRKCQGLKSFLRDLDVKIKLMGHETSELRFICGSDCVTFFFCLFACLKILLKNFCFDIDLMFALNVAQC